MPTFLSGSGLTPSDLQIQAPFRLVCPRISRASPLDDTPAVFTQMAQVSDYAARYTVINIVCRKGR